jgi:4-hydroxybenzoate polyprenyltransferase
MQDAATQIPADTQHRGLIALLPAALLPYALLARFDRPIGWWLLFWPCVFGVALAGQALARWDAILLMLVGAIAMRGAGCVYNDIVDRDLDRQVARTAQRPLASGAVSLRAAWLWLFALCLIGLAVLLQLNRLAQIISLASLALVAAYPFMKRITWWPQAWLGIVFSWGALVGWAEATEMLRAPLWWLYAGSILWVIGYDTIYALQDVEDDAMVGIRSSARRLGENARVGVMALYIGALIFWGIAIWTTRPDALALASLLPAAVHLIWQVATLDTANAKNALDRFRSNRTTGLLIAAAMIVVGTSA